MRPYLIVVVNRALARFFTLKEVDFPESASGPRITPLTELENPELQDSQEVFSDSKTGRGAAPQGGGVHGYDDKRDHHLDEFRRRFAVKVLERIAKAAKDEHASTLVLAASERMRRFLYPEMDALAQKGYRIHKVSKNIIHFSPEEIREYLAASGTIPARVHG